MRVKSLEWRRMCVEWRGTWKEGGYKRSTGMEDGKKSAEDGLKW